MKPTLTLTGPKDVGPTPDDLIALYRKLTGRDPSPDDIADLRKKYEAKVAKSA